MKEHMLAQEGYDTAKDLGFKKGILLHAYTYKVRDIFVRVKESLEDIGGSHSVPLESRKISECTSEE